MSEPSSQFAPRWTWRATAASAALAVLTGLPGVPVPEAVTGVLVVGTLLGALVLLYRWGQHRERPDGDADDETARRQTEMETEAGGYGGNAGG